MKALLAACAVMAGMFVLTITLAVVLDKPDQPKQKRIETERVLWV